MTWRYFILSQCTCYNVKHDKEIHVLRTVKLHQFANGRPKQMLGELSTCIGWSSLFVLPSYSTFSQRGSKFSILNIL